MRYSLGLGGLEGYGPQSSWGVVPDIMCLAKGIAGGIPMGLVLARRDVMDSLSIGEHSNTFGGNPLACAAAKATLECIVDDKLVDNAANVGKYMYEGLLRLKDKYKIVRDVRGLGLMLGIELRFDVKDILLDGLKHNILLLYSGRNVIRLLPPLIIDEEIAGKALTILDTLLNREQERRGIK